MCTGNRVHRHITSEVDQDSTQAHDPSNDSRGKDSPSASSPDSELSESSDSSQQNVVGKYLKHADEVKHVSLAAFAWLYQTDTRH